jgi:hypothetical protein
MVKTYNKKHYGKTIIKTTPTPAQYEEAKQVRIVREKNAPGAADLRSVHGEKQFTNEREKRL